MTQKDYVIRQASASELDAIKDLVDLHKRELGFVLRPVLARSIEQGELMVAVNGTGLVGLVQYHHRRDEQTTLHNIVVHPDYRKNGIGRRLLQSLEVEAHARGKAFILLKCPEDLSANLFYEQLGYERVDVETGKYRQLNIWRKDVRESMRYLYCD